MKIGSEFAIRKWMKCKAAAIKLPTLVTIASWLITACGSFNRELLNEQHESINQSIIDWKQSYMLICGRLWVQAVYVVAVNKNI